MLADMIDTTNDMDEDIVNKWNSVAAVLLEKHVDKKYKVEQSIANKYIHDFEGLLLSLDITPDVIYPHILVNGYKSSSEYNGSLKDIIMLDRSVLINYIDLFT